MTNGLPQTVHVEFSLAVGPGRLDASVEVPAGEVTLTQLLPVLQSLTNNIIASAVEIVNNEGFQISCRAGCGACCRQLVPLSLFEAEALADWIRSLPAEQQEALQSRFQAAIVALRDNGMLARLDPELWTDEFSHRRQLSIDYLAEKVPCPFLVEESCSIHPIRPLICREYLVTSSPEFCVAPSEATVDCVPLPIKPSKALFHLGARLQGTTRGWIPLVFLFAWMKAGIRPGDYISGPGPEVLRGFVEQLAKL